MKYDGIKIKERMFNIMKKNIVIYGVVVWCLNESDEEKNIQ